MGDAAKKEQTSDPLTEAVALTGAVLAFLWMIQDDPGSKSIWSIGLFWFMAAAFFAVSFRTAMPTLPIMRPTAVIIAVGAALGTHSFWRDVVAMAVAFLLAAFVTGSGLGPLRKAWWRESIGRRNWWLEGVMLVLSWVFVFALDERAFSARRKHHALRDWRAVPDLFPQRSVGVALSGGGYRAALFHAGVLSELENLGVKPRALSSVSGGSIVGAYYAIGGSPDSLASLIGSGSFNVKRNLLAPWNLVRLAVTTRIPRTDIGIGTAFTRTDVQARLLDRLLFGGVNLKDPALSGGPELVLGTTDLISGDAFGIFRHGLVRIRHVPKILLEPFVNNPIVRDSLVPIVTGGERVPGLVGGRLSGIVAASGAFPGAFAPVIVKAEAIRSEPLVLADGGITDNTGTEILGGLAVHALRLAKDTGGPPPVSSSPKQALATAIRRYRTDVLIVSDASALPVSTMPSSTLAYVGKALDAVYRSTGGMSSFESYRQALPKELYVSPMALIEFVSGISVESGDGTPQSGTVRFAFEGPFVRVPPHDPRRATLIPNYQQLTMATLRRILASLPATERDSAERLLPRIDSLVALELKLDSLWNGSRVRWQATRKAVEQKLLELGLADTALYELLLLRLSKDLGVFMTSSTLEDRYNQANADALVRLGRFMVLLNRVPLERTLASPPS